MAPRPVWKGYLRLSLVSCAVELSNATDHSEKVSFRTLNRKTGNTVRRQYVDGVSGKPVPDADEVSQRSNSAPGRRTASCRHASFQGLREDKPAEEVVAEKPSKIAPARSVKR